MLDKVKERRWILIAIGAILLSFSIFFTACTPTPTPFPANIPADINPDQSTLDPTDADGASGGRVNGLASDANGANLYLASEWGGLFKSSNSGLTWSRLNGHLPSVTWDVAVDPANANRLYATSFFDGRVNSLAGINVSTDGGVTWTHPGSATPPEGFCADANRRNEPSAFGISIDPDDPEDVYIGTNCGLAVSTDSGATWTYIDPTPGDPADNIWDVVVHDGSIIDLCGDDGHQRSTDGGGTWTTAAGAGLPSGRCSIAVSPDEAYVLFAVVGTTIYESDDGGATWPTVLTNPRAQGRIPFVATNQRSGNTFDLWFGDVQLHRATCTTPAPANPGGAARCPINTWTGPFTRAAGGHDDTGDILFDPTTVSDACPLLFSSDGGVYYNTQSTSPACQSPAWEQPNITPHALWVFGLGGADVAGEVAEDLYFGTQDNGTFAATNAGALPKPTWNNRDCCDAFDISADATSVLYTQCCYFPAPANRMFLRNPGMTGGGEINTYPPGNLPGFRAIDIVDQFGPNQYVVVTSNGVYITNNITANPIVWTQIGAATTPANVCNVRATVAGGTTTFHIQANNCNNQTPNNPRNLWRFVGTNPAGNWQQVNPPSGVGGFGVYDVDASDPNRIFASHLQNNVNPAMVMTTDGGATWTNMPALDNLMTGGGVFNYRNNRGPTNFTSVNGYPQPSLVAIDPQDPDILVAGGSDSGVFLSLDGGANWDLVTDPIDPVSSGKPHIPRPQFAYFDHEPASLSDDVVNIYLGTKGRGVWRLRVVVESIFNPCLSDPDLCPPELDTGLIKLDCSGLDFGEPCIFTDPIPRNCLVKFDCPGCEGVAGLCPPFYHIFLDDLDPSIWDVGIYTGKGELVQYEIFTTEKGVVLSFRPSEELFVEGEIGDYLLAFRLNPSAELTTYLIQTRLEVSDQPYAPR